MRSRVLLWILIALCIGILVGAIVGPLVSGIPALRGVLTGADEEEATAVTHEGLPEDSAVVVLTPSQRQLAAIQTVVARQGQIDVDLEMPAEVCLNGDRLAHIVPPLEGIIRQVTGRLGEAVTVNETVAIIESRDLGDMKIAYLQAKQTRTLAQTQFEREDRLWQQKVSSEQDYLTCKQALAEAEIAFRSSKQKLLTLGLTKDSLATLDRSADETMTLYAVTAPFAGTLIDRHAVPGQILTGEAIFSLADLSTVWVLGSVYERDIRKVHVGQRATVAVSALGDDRFEGKVTWIADVLDEETRTLNLRVELPNPDHLLKAGMAARVFVTVDRREDVLLVPIEALRLADEQSVLFVDEGQGRYQMRSVEVGLQSGPWVEICSGIQTGETVVTNGSFTLLSESQKAGFEQDDD